MTASNISLRSASLALICTLGAAELLPAQFQLIQTQPIQYGPYLTVDDHSKPRQAGVGNAHIGASLQTSAATGRRTAGIAMPGFNTGSVHYFQGSLDVSANLDVHLFDRSARAAEASFHGECRNGEWEEYWDAAAGKFLPRNFRAVNIARASRRLRVAGMDIELPAIATEASFTVQRNLNLFDYSFSAIRLGPATITVRCYARVIAGYYANLTLGGNRLTGFGNAYSWVEATSRLSASMPLLSSGVDHEIRIGGVANYVNVELSSGGTTAENGFSITPLRLRVQPWIKISYLLGSKTYRTTIYDETPFGGFSESVTF